MDVKYTPDHLSFSRHGINPLFFNFLLSFLGFEAQAINSPSLNYSHFISLPLAIHPELVDKLVKFQNSILGTSDSFQDETVESDSNEDTSDNEDKDKDLSKGSDVAVSLKVEDDNYVKVDLTSMPLVSYAPKASRSTTLSGRI